MIFTVSQILLLLFGTSYGQQDFLSNAFRGRIIINGRDAREGEFPYQVSLQRKAYWGDATIHMCGGTIIDEHHVLTAGHCVYYQYTPNLVVVAGTRDYSVTTDPNRVNLTAEEVYLHEDYEDDYYFNDIALIRVSPGFPLDSQYISPIAMREEQLQEPTDCTVTGWGTTQLPIWEFPDILQALDLPLLDYELCKELYEDYPPKGYFIPGMLCAGYIAGVKDACTYDSGGPLVCRGQLTGIVSWGESCAVVNYPGVYADVAYYKDWIRSTLAKSYEDAGLQQRSFL